MNGGPSDEAIKECGFALAKKKRKPIKEDNSSYVTVPFDLLAHGRCAS